ncbi:unnamed protein product [Boreogadus saida]
MSQVWFGYMKALQGYELTSCLTSRVQEMLAMAECMESIVTDHRTSPSAPEAPEETPKKKKKNPPASEKKKKKKKDEGPKDEGQEHAVTVSEQHGSDSSGYLSDKPSRKRRLEMAVEMIPCPREDPQRPKSKKKRKSDA